MADCVEFNVWTLRCNRKEVTLPLFQGKQFFSVFQIMACRSRSRRTTPVFWPLFHIYEFSLNVFAEFSDKNICHYSKRVQTCHPATSCVRDHDATTAPARHMWETGSLNWALFILQWFIKICWIQWIPVPFRENSIVRLNRRDRLLVFKTYSKWS